MSQFLSQLIGIRKVKSYQADGSSVITSDSVDLQAEGADGVCFLTTFETAAADNILKVQKSSDNSSWSDITGGAVVPGASDEVQYVDIISPPERYVRASCARGTSTVLGEIYALLYRLREQPFDNNVVGTIAGKRLTQPA